MITTVKVSSKGQIVLPIDIREKISIKQGDVLLLHLVGDKIIIEPIKKTTKKNWEKVLKETSGILPDNNPNYIDELRASSLKKAGGKKGRKLRPFLIYFFLFPGKYFDIIFQGTAQWWMRGV
jgi:AbrB family looped-hinge helix DNA binding protein